MTDKTIKATTANNAHDAQTNAEASPVVTRGSEAITVTLRGKALGQRMADLKASLEAACAAIDAAPEFASDPEGTAEAGVLRKLGAYRAWLVENHLPPHVYLARPFARRILEFIGHPGLEATIAVRAEIEGLSDLLPAGGAATAPVRPDRIDGLADDYAAKMRKREFGLPRNQFHKIHWPAAAEEMGCEPDEISTSVKGRLRAVDREIGVPGPTADRPARAGSRAKANPAVRPLLAAELGRRGSRMPADPMQPGEIDLVEIAHHAGVSVRDLTEASDTNEHLAAIEAARGDGKLVPHPAIEERRFTFRQLKEFGRQMRKVEAKADGVAGPGDAARMTVRAMTRFLQMPRLGGRTTDKVPLDLPARIRRAIAAKPAGFESGWSSQMARWIRYFDAMRSAQPLPENWTSALRILAAEIGVGRNEIVASAGPAAQSWLKGISFPAHQSKDAVTALEKTLRVDAGTLAKRLAPEWRAQRPEVGISKLGRGGVGRVLSASIVGLQPDQQKAVIEDHWAAFRTQGTEFSMRLTEQIKSRYRLKFAKWPAVMQDAWEEQTPDVAKEDVSKEITGRVPGQRPGKAGRAFARKDADRGWRVPTAKISKGLMEMFFGYLARSREEPAAKGGANDNGFVDGPGLDLPTELIHPVLFAVVDLMAGYKYWRRDRSGGHFGPHIAYTMWQAADYLKPETGLVWKNPDFLEHLERFAKWWEDSGAKLGVGSLVLDLDAFREDWHAAVEEAWEIMREDAGEIRPNDPERPKIRDPFIVLEGYLADPKADPMAKYMVPLRQMLASKPLTAMDRHLHRRNSILALILIQTALRASTMLLTVSGPEPTLRREEDEEGTVSWRITIPAAKFKNFYSPYFAKGAPYEFTLDDEDGLYMLLDQYMAVSRPYLLANRKSDALFITSGGRACKATDLSNIYRNLTGVFFVWNPATKTGIKGVRRHGMHAVRHIVATSLLRTTGDIYLAAWAIQDTARTVERHYGRFLPRDKVRLAVEHLRKSRKPKPAPAPAKPERRVLAA